MLGANKSLLLATVRTQAVDLRKLELDTLVDRFGGMIGIAAMSTGFIMGSMIEFEIPLFLFDQRDTDEVEVSEQLRYASQNMVSTLYIALSIALSAGMFVLATATVLINAGYRLALSGSEHRAADRAVAVLYRSFPMVVGVGALGLVMMLVSGLCVCFVKMASLELPVAWVTTAIFIVFGFLVTGYYIYELEYALRSKAMVRGDVEVELAGEQLNLEDLSVPHNPAEINPLSRAAFNAAGRGSVASAGGEGAAPPPPTFGLYELMHTERGSAVMAEASVFPPREASVQDGPGYESAAQHVDEGSSVWKSIFGVGTRYGIDVPAPAKR